MTGDALRSMAAKPPRKPDKRKKRRSKKRINPPNSGDIGPQSTENPYENIINPSALPLAEALVEPAFDPPVPMVMEKMGKPGMSPRKQTLMRHKTSNESTSEPSFVSEVKEIKRNRKEAAHAKVKLPNPDAVDGRYSLILSRQSMEEKTSLFSFKLLKIVLYQEHLHESPMRASPGTLLAHGEFEIFQLHGGDVTYLACGKSFVYPLLPKLKILRTSASEFVLPLVNPQRYWKIHIDTLDEIIIKQLEAILKKVVKYTNLAALEEQPPGGDGNKNTSINTKTSTSTTTNTNIRPQEGAPVVDPHAGHVEDRISTPPPSLCGPDSSFPCVPPKLAQYTPYFNEIPESPPSAPVSPHQPDMFKNAFTLSAPEPLIPAWEVASMPQDVHRDSLPSMTAAVANFGLANFAEVKDHGKDDGNRAHALLQPTPQALVNPYYHEQLNGMVKANKGGHENAQNHHKSHDTRSESSSMDSLLDEYEENISVTRSVQQNISQPVSRSVSRPVSRPASHISAARSTTKSTAIRHLRPLFPLQHDADKNELNTGKRTVWGTAADRVPPSSGSRYNHTNHTNQNSIGGRSRQSSVSELYSSTSNWMEPGIVASTTNPLTSSKSTYSLSGFNNLPQHQRPTLTETYRDIYRSISLHDININSAMPHSKAQDANPYKKAPPTCNLRLKKLVVDAPRPRRSENMIMATSGPPGPDRIGPRGQRTDGLSSNEVFRLLSERDSLKNQQQQQPQSSGLRRLFGW